MVGWSRVQHPTRQSTIYTREKVAKFTTISQPKSWGSDLYAGHKVKNFFPVAEMCRFRQCDVVPLGQGTHHRLLPVVHCQFTVAYLHGAL